MEEDDDDEIFILTPIGIYWPGWPWHPHPPQQRPCHREPCPYALAYLPDRVYTRALVPRFSNPVGMRLPSSRRISVYTCMFYVIMGVSTLGFLVKLLMLTRVFPYEICAQVYRFRPHVCENNPRCLWNIHTRCVCVCVFRVWDICTTNSGTPTMFNWPYKSGV